MREQIYRSEETGDDIYKIGAVDEIRRRILRKDAFFCIGHYNDMVKVVGVIFARRTKLQDITLLHLCNG